MTALRKIASLGRSIVCTIHQPSAELFFHFDDLLLLKAGGHTVYFGPIGFRGVAVRTYFESLAGVTRMPRRMNPASWVVDVVSGAALNPAASSAAEAKADSPVTLDFPALFKQSTHHAAAEGIVTAALVCTVVTAAALSLTGWSAPSCAPSRFQCLCKCLLRRVSEIAFACTVVVQRVC